MYNSFLDKVLLAEILDTSITNIILNNYSLDLDKVAEFENYKKLLRKGYPLSYILKKCNFLGQEYFLDEGLLIPRPETEELVTKICSLKKFLQNTICLEVGIGTGVISLNFLQNKIFKSYLAIDTNPKAIQISQQNLKLKNQKSKKINFFQSDLLKNKKLKQILKKERNLVLVANLPYVPIQDILKSKENLINFEPRKSIYSGYDGLNLFSTLLRQIQYLDLKFNFFAFELDSRNIRKASKKLKKLCQKVIIIKDYMGKERFLFGFNHYTLGAIGRIRTCDLLDRNQML